MPNYNAESSISRRLNPTTLVATEAFKSPAARPADVVLGQPQANCRYHGICRIDSPGLPAPRGCQGSAVSAVLAWYAPNNCRLIIPRNQLCIKLEKYYFGTKEIVLHRQQSLAPFWTINTKDKYISTGRYTISLMPQHYVIQLVVR